MKPKALESAPLSPRRLVQILPLFKWSQARDSYGTPLARWYIAQPPKLARGSRHLAVCEFKIHILPRVLSHKDCLGQTAELYQRSLLDRSVRPPKSLVVESWDYSYAARMVSLGGHMRIFLTIAPSLFGRKVDYGTNIDLHTPHQRKQPSSKRLLAFGQQDDALRLT